MRAAALLWLLPALALAQGKPSSSGSPSASFVTQPSNSASVPGSLKVGDSGAPGQKLHVTGGNVLIDGAGESAGILMKRNGAVHGQLENTGATDPIFQWGRIYATPYGPAFSIFYWHNGQAERRIWSQENTGTAAVILDGVKRSALESFAQDGHVKPWFRLSNYPESQLELGPGASTETDVHLRRSAANTFQVVIGGGSRLQVNGDTVYVPEGIQLHTRGAVRHELWLHGGNQTASSQRYFAVYADQGSSTETLPTCAGKGGLTYSFKKVDPTGNTVTIDPAGSETIDGASTLVLSAQWQKATLVCDGANWLTY